MKKIFLSLLLLFNLSVLAKNTTNSHHIDLKESLLWKVTGKNIVQPSYLYGTMHMICDAKAFKTSVANAMDSSKQLFLEMDMDDPTLMMELMSLATSGKKIKDLEDEAIKNKLLSTASQILDMKEKILENTTLFYLMSMTMIKALPECDTVATSVEQNLINVFKNSKKEIEGLETVEQQMSFVQDSGITDAKTLLKSFEYFKEAKEMYENMTDIYRQENIESLFSLMSTPSKFASQEDIDKMLENLLANRNKNWVIKIPKIAEKQPTFFGFGAGHLGGDIGVINLLRQAGYTVEAVIE